MKTYKSNDCLPPLLRGGGQSQQVTTPEGLIVSYDYKNKVWKDAANKEVSVTSWSYLPPSRTNPPNTQDNTIHSFESVIASLPDMMVGDTNIKLKEMFDRDDCIVLDVKKVKEDEFAILGQDTTNRMNFVYFSRVFHLFLDVNDAIKCFKDL